MARSWLTLRGTWIAIAAVLVLIAVTTLLRARRRSKSAVADDPSAASARPLEEHGGRCSKPFLAEDVPCPYVGMPGPDDDYGAPFAGNPEGTCRHAGDLVMPSGELVADDPLVFLDDRAFTVKAAPGTYPVFLARPKDLSGDVALALLRIREARPVRWEIAKLPNEKPGHHFYPVDSGTGCYVDRVTAQTILARQKAELDRQTDIVLQSGVDPNDVLAWHEAMERARGERKDLLQLLYDAGYHDGPSASLCIDADTGGNLVVFTSGAGDGQYGVYAGYDAGGALVAFVTDFHILPIE